jgi:calcium-dependent protein kinase
MGVILYILLSGYPPFNGPNDNEIMKAVVEGKYSFSGPEWKNISNDAKDLIKNLLQYDPATRFDCEQIMNHIWIQKCCS